MRRVLALLVCAGLAGCSTVSGSINPHAPGRWHELHSEHFTLTTDLAPTDAQAALENLEQVRAALLAGAWSQANVQGDHLDVVILSTHYELTEFTRETVGGYMNHGLRPLLVEAPLGKVTPLIVAHELTHWYSMRLLQRQPEWFREGIADFLGTVQLHDGMAELGDANLMRVEVIRRYGLMPVGQVLAEQKGDFHRDAASDVHRFYATAWLLVHYLFNVEPGRFREYQLALARAEDPTAAWERIFADLAPDKLDAALDQYVRHGSFRVLQVPVPATQVAPSPQRALSEAEVRELRARLFLVTPGPHTSKEREALAREELQPVFDQDPANPAALAIAVAWREPAELLPLARKAVAEHPDDANAWRALYASLAGSTDPALQAEKLRSAERVAQLSPDDALSLNNYAWTLTEQGRAAEALAPARRAVGLNPAPTVVDTLATTLAAMGQCAEAITDERRAIDTLEPELERQRAEFRARLDEMQKTCGKR